MTKFCTFASGSAGNASFLSSGTTHLLIDMGISCRRICASLSRIGMCAKDLSAILITHYHGDHIGGLATYIKKYTTPIITTSATADQLSLRFPGIISRIKCVDLGEQCVIGDVTVTVLPTSHDCKGSCAFYIATPEGTVGYITDTGMIPQETAQMLLGTELLVLESNHDIEMLCSGSYPYSIKERILGERGHLSNHMAANFAADSARAGTQSIILAHLSAENNTPQIARDTVREKLKAVGYCGYLSVAPEKDMSEVYTIGVSSCSV
ncbi:MAG: MBL fold metallo-hydrolase [Oscillospiraceae bacterium]|nr:MBL fold metallo-hydrolase [Oscillospiraceae bacterium]